MLKAVYGDWQKMAVQYGDRFIINGVCSKLVFST